VRLNVVSQRSKPSSPLDDFGEAVDEDRPYQPFDYTQYDKPRDLGIGPGTKIEIGRQIGGIEPEVPKHQRTYYRAFECAGVGVQWIISGCDLNTEQHA